MNRLRRTLCPTALAALMMFSISHAQYYIDTTVVLPTQPFRSQVIPFALTTAREDVQAIGMGRAQISNNRQRPQMFANPALLAVPRTAVDVLNVQAGIPGQTLDAIDFIKANTFQFQQSIYLQDIKGGIDDFNNAITPEQYLAAIQRMNKGLGFIDDLIKTVSGGQESPRTHGIRIIPMAQAQVGNFGFSVLATAQSGFQVASGQPLEELKNFKVPEDLSDPLAIQQALQKLLSAVGAIFDQFGNISPDALPKVYAVSFIDIIGTAGYGTHLMPNLDAGVALKIINRRFSTSIIPAQNLGDLISETRKNFQSNTTGITADVGFLYKMPSTGTRIALTAENIIPIQTIESDVNVDVAVTGIAGYARTSYPAGPIKTNANGDTGLVAVRQPIAATFPFQLKAPFIATVGAQHPLAPNWDVAFEWTDIASQSNLYSKFTERVRLGTEYRFTAFSNSVNIAGRLGFAVDHLTYGLGLTFFRVVELDGAIAHDAFTNASSYYGQLRIGW